MVTKNIIYCGKCNAAMGYRIEPRPDGWEESWRCFVCGRVIRKNHDRTGKVLEESDSAKAAPVAETSVPVQEPAQQEPVFEKAETPEKQEEAAAIAEELPVKRRRRRRAEEMTDQPADAPEAAETAPDPEPPAEVVQEKRHRGRPPKAPVEVKSEEVTAEQQVEEKPKRGRGRPPKAKPAEEAQQFMELGLQPSTEGEPPKRGRGRPRKIQL